MQIVKTKSEIKPVSYWKKNRNEIPDKRGIYFWYAKEEEMDLLIDLYKICEDDVLARKSRVPKEGDLYQIYVGEAGADISCNNTLNKRFTDHLGNAKSSTMKKSLYSLLFQSSVKIGDTDENAHDIAEKGSKEITLKFYYRYIAYSCIDDGGNDISNTPEGLEAIGAEIEKDERYYINKDGGFNILNIKEVEATDYSKGIAALKKYRTDSMIRRQTVRDNRKVKPLV